MPFVLAAIAAAATATGAAAAPPAPPWKRFAPLSARSGDARIVAAQWRVADNRDDCAPLAPSSVRVGGVTGARARRAEFSGGWGVAWDTPGRRSAFGVAGAGVTAQPGDVERWPTVIRWSDGSKAGYGLEGDTGPGYLAYLQVRGQGCLYNVWSNVGARHLRLLIGQLRLVRGA